MSERTCDSSKAVNQPTFCTVLSQANVLGVEMSLENYPGFLLNFSECEMTGELKHSYLFKSFRLNITERQLLRDNLPVSLTPKAFDVLALLVEQNGHLVEK